jgi:hypothetical protein
MRAAGYGGGIEMPSGLNGTSFGVSLIQQLRAVRNVVNNRGEKDNARQQRYQLRVFEDSVQYASSSHRTASPDDWKGNAAAPFASRHGGWAQVQGNSNPAAFAVIEVPVTLNEVR